VIGALNSDICPAGECALSGKGFKGTFAHYGSERKRAERYGKM
jgi:hypothetical protein